MRQFVAPVAVATFIALFGTSSWAKTMTVKGQVVDEGCSLREMGQKGGDHKAAEMDQCAIDCAKRGEPVALLTADGKVYRISGGLLIAANELKMAK